MRDIDKIIVHCSDSTFGSVDMIRSWHIENGWRDIGYHYVIANGYYFKADKYEDNIQDGLVEEGRPLAVSGAHTKGENSSSIGICLIGTDEFTEKQRVSLGQLLIGLMNQFNIDPIAVRGHYDYSTKTCPNFNVQTFMKNYVLGD